jgi:hypothetical protein
VTARTARRTNRLPDFATEDAVLPADFTADRTVFFTVAATFFLVGFLAGVFLDFDPAGLRAMESSSQWLSRKHILESPGAWKGERQGQALG